MTMYVEVFESARDAKQRWHWHFRSRNGRIVADAESFPTKAHAVRAAKACVKAITGSKRLPFSEKEIGPDRFKIVWPKAGCAE